MDVFKKRTLLFLMGCIPMRLLFAGVAKTIPTHYLPYFGFISLFIGISFVYLYFFGNGRADAQLLWTGEKHIWWNYMRIFHGFIYILFAVLAWQQKPYAWTVLFFDALMGLVVWVKHHNLTALV